MDYFDICIFKNPSIIVPVSDVEEKTNQGDIIDIRVSLRRIFFVDVVTRHCHYFPYLNFKSVKQEVDDLS